LEQRKRICLQNSFLEGGMQLFGGAILVFWAAAGLKNAAMPAKAIKKVEQRQ
jgi:hypothetical protein